MKTYPFTPVSWLSGKKMIPAIIFLLCLLLYGNTLYNEYAYDDIIYTHNDFIIKGFSAFTDIFDKGSLYGWNKTVYVQQYRPLTLLNFMAEVSLFGFNSHVSHFFNILFFAITVVLLYFFLKKILKNYNKTIIIAATLLFSFHPIHTEVVANIKSRDEILGLLFGVTSFYFIMLYHEKKKNNYYFFSVIAFFAALFCKESCVTFIAIIPLLLYFFTRLEIKKIALISLPYFGAVAVYLFIRSRVLQSMTFTNQIPVMDNVLTTATNSADRIATSFVLLGKYIYMTIIPYPLSYDYSYNQIPIVSWGNIKPIISLLVCAVLIGYMLWGFRKKSIFSFLIAFFFITLFISSNFIIKIGSTFGERFLYVPSLSFCIALPILIAKLWKNRTYFYAPVTCLLIIYTIIVIPRNAEWKNNFTLYSSGVITSPNSQRTHKSLANVYLDSVQNSKEPKVRLRYYPLTIQEFRKALAIFSMDPECYYNLGACYNKGGFPDSAIMAYKKSLAIDKNYSMAANNLGTIYFDRTQYDSALFYFFMSYKNDSANLDALINITSAYQSEKNIPLAFHYDSLLLKKAPGNKLALNNLSKLHNYTGAQYYSNNELNKALEEYTIALNIDSNNADVIGNMGGLYAKEGNIEMAKKYFQKALLKDPKNEGIAKYLQLLNEKH